jgi:hypothetical protein
LYGGDKLKNLLLKLINLTFEHYSVPDLLKVGTLTPIYKNKGLMTESKNYRGITITPTLSKIIETILKFRINGNILSVQNPLQRGLTENSTSPILEEIERENKDRKTPTINLLLTLYVILILFVSCITTEFLLNLYY